MGLLDNSRPSKSNIDQFLASECVSVTAKNKGKRFRLSDTSSNVTAGGPGSGRKKEVEDYLQKQGFHLMHSYRTEADDKRPSFWSKTVKNHPEDVHDRTNATHHMVTVDPDGTWTHSSEALHHGNSSEDLAGLNLAASAVEGNGLASLKAHLSREMQATDFTEDRRDKLAKKKQAEPDGSFPIRNKTDLRHAKQDLGRAGNKASDRAWINKRAKQLGGKKIGAGNANTPQMRGKMKSKNEDAVEYYSGGPGSGPKTKNEAHKNSTIGKLADRFAKFTSNPKHNPDVTKLFKAGGQGSGRHKTVSEVGSKLRKLGFAYKTSKTTKREGNDWTEKEHHYEHPNGTKATIFERKNGQSTVGFGKSSNQSASYAKVDNKIGKNNEMPQLGADNLDNKKIIKHLEKFNAGGVGSGRKKEFAKATRMSDRHEQRMFRHFDKADHTKSKARADYHENLGNKHGDAQDHYDDAIDHYANGRDAEGDRSMKKAASVEKNIAILEHRA